ncbi:hypothetical protein [Epibacterium ulvae]|uniref:hypothetical protein n=1 Tax=Epibacterium ulvae TaxID=1156985 RepID=UPI0024936D80|nr:hypothetical protein [Epibacterium ulvae]
MAAPENWLDAFRRILAKGQATYAGFMTVSAISLRKFSTLMRNPFIEPLNFTQNTAIIDL